MDFVIVIRQARGGRSVRQMVVYSDADISEPNTDTDGELAEEPFDASDDDEMENVQCGYCNFSVTATDIETMTGILLKMGITSMPRYRMYWAAGSRLDFVAE
ncbi:hypothetical protein T11_9338 [Trichinella zimbabwensis]|uniref:PiggyBac transposable element-derived protein domain-containing protein n=1 Tax=Trichinella zimbabwensis TaxID=268475 RepID=A0A0V1HZH2_9BILA|nr:hypothetical protein T11_9338 [Trichinella zimbabwensis]